MKRRDTQIDAIVVRLTEVLAEATEGTVTVDRADSGPESIRRLGLNSVSMLAFLVAVEDEFGIEWDDEIDEEILASFDTMAAHIAAERGR
jgi:acyl carrier protein